MKGKLKKELFMTATIFDTLKVIAVSLFGGIVSYLNPLFDPMSVLLFVFVLDIVFGILVDLIKNHDRIRVKKTLIALAFLTMYMLIIASTYVVGEKMGDGDEALYIVKILTYVFTYFYFSNMIRNMRQLAPSSKALAFLDYFIGLQIVKRLPELADFLGLSAKEQNKEDFVCVDEEETKEIKKPRKRKQ